MQFYNVESFDINTFHLLLLYHYTCWHLNHFSFSFHMLWIHVFYKLILGIFYVLVMAVHWLHLNNNKNNNNLLKNSVCAWWNWIERKIGEMNNLNTVHWHWYIFLFSLISSSIKYLWFQCWMTKAREKCSSFI